MASPSDSDSLNDDSGEEELSNGFQPYICGFQCLNDSLNQDVAYQSISSYVDLPWDRACRRRNFELILSLVGLDLPSVNYQNSTGITLLMLAAADSSDARGARLLVESGAETGLCDNEGRMALHFAANSGNIELLQYILQHTETSSIEQWFMNIPNVLQAKSILHSLVGCAIHSGNVMCLEILLSSGKLSKRILQAPYVRKEYSYRCTVFFPVAYVFSNLVHFEEEKLNSYLELLLKHKITMPGEFFRALKIEWPTQEVTFQNPFFRILCPPWPISKQQHYFHWFNENGVTIDYCVHGHDTSQPFASFTDYQHYYGPVMDTVNRKQIETLKLIMYNSAILEPEELIIQVDINRPYWHSTHSLGGTNAKDQRDVYKYLISLKPVYYNQDQLRERIGKAELLWYPYSTISEEFAESTLQQLCRTTIRHQIRGHTVEDNLRNFRENILSLPLPPSLKEFLLFKSEKA